MDLENPAGTEGFDFLEFSTTDLKKLTMQLESMGFKACTQHKDHSLTIFQQGGVRFLVNTTPGSHAAQFAGEHGASASAMGFRVKDARAAYQRALDNGAKPYHPEHFGTSPYKIPAIYGVGDSLIYFVDYQNGKPNYANNFNGIPDIVSGEGGLTYIDHVTHNLQRGHMATWYNFYVSIFNFREIRFFDISGKLTGLKSQALTSPCGKIRIPLNESSDDQSQIEEFIHDFKGEGIQHIALGTDDIYQSVSSLKHKGMEFLDTPDTYYELIEKRLPNHGESTDLLRELRILIDGNINNDEKCLLLQIFTKNMLGPVFFEIIQRKGDEGFGEGNFKALFESIELDQIRRGVLIGDKEKT